MEGANLSGDLKNPASSLPKGTLSAMATSFTTYVLFATFLALCYDRQSLRCEYLILQKTAVSPYVVVVGIAMATLSTSLGAMFGAARILQVIILVHALSQI
jgi:potassium/chloride transporter 9